MNPYRWLQQCWVSHHGWPGSAIFFMGPAVEHILNDIGVGTVEKKYYY